jgi:hypothetical protein
MKKSLPQTPGEFFPKFFGDLREPSNGPRLQVLLTNCYLEFFVHLMAVNGCKSRKMIEDSGRDFPHAVKIALLHEAGGVTDEEATFLHWFRKKRNDAAHEVEFDVTEDEVQKMWTSMTSYLGTLASHEVNLRNLCFAFLMSFWNRRKTELGRLMFPRFRRSA